MTQVRAHTRDREAKIETITNTFLELVKEHGYSRVSTNHIARKAQISIGTVYRYFPEGKQAIIRDFFTRNREEIINLGDFDLAAESTLELTIESFIRRHLKVHKKNQAIFSALMQALLANDDLSKDYLQMVIYANSELVKKLRKKNQLFKSLPEKKIISKFLLIYQTLEAITTRHLYFQPLFAEEESFIKFLKQLVMVIITDL